MSLLREIQDTATDGNTELATVLRKCMVLASRLGHEDFKNWVDQELNGYASKEKLPSYRVFQVQSSGHFVGSGGQQLRHAPIALFSIPEKFRDAVRTVYLTEGVSNYENQVKTAKGEAAIFYSWPPELVVAYGSQIYEDMGCLGAWMNIPASALVGMLDIVRNKILKFVLEIEVIAPEVGEAAPGTQPLSKESIKYIFNTYISGGTNAIATGSSDFSQAVQQEILLNDLNSLEKYLKSLGIASEDLQDLQISIQEDESRKDSKKIGDKVGGWIGKMVGKTVSGAWQVSTAVAADVLSKAISRYYGLG